MKLMSLLVLLISSPLFAAQENCVHGKSAEKYPCEKIDLLSELDLKASGWVKATRGNDIWGWTDPVTKKEYALMGLSNKTSIVDVTNPTAPTHLVDIETQTEASTWRDIKVYKDHAYVVSEAAGHGMQVFDLTRLRQINSYQLLKPDAHYYGFGSAHNVAINEDSGFAYAVGTDTCHGGMHVINIKKPKVPRFSTCVGRSVFEPAGPVKEDGEAYTHDVQCVNYQGPDTRFHGREICVASNEDSINIVDMTDKRKPVQLSVATYNGVAYVHQGWLTEDQGYFLLGDELDEKRFNMKTRTYIWDVRDLTEIKMVGYHTAETNAIDHNLYTHEGKVYQANYDAGLRILDLAEVAQGKLTELAYFDMAPNSDRATFGPKGIWSVYPYFNSGTIICSGVDGVLFVLKANL